MKKNTTVQPLWQEETAQQDNEAVRMQDKAAYKERVVELSAEDQAFMDGYLFAKVTELSQKRA